VILAAAMALLLFVPAGTIRYWQAWVYLAIFTGASALPGVVVAADVLVLVGLVFIVRVYRENTFTSATIEIAENQNVVSPGPSALCPPPMYAGGLLSLAATPLALASYWGLVPIAAMTPFLIWRLLDEERMLATNLTGYAEYQRRVRYRLIPFVW